jgi:ATP-dependent Lon protease
LAIFAQTDESNEAPGQADLHPVGVAARLVALVETQDRGTWIVVRSLRWIHLDAIERSLPHALARVSAFEVVEEKGAEVERLHRTLKERARAFAATLPDAERLRRLVEGMTALQLADATIANLTCPVSEKARYADEPSLLRRLEIVLALVGE